MTGRLVALSAAVAFASSAGAQPAPDSAAVADSLAYESYLGDLESDTDAMFDIEALSISDAEVDSLIRVLGRTGESPYEAREGTPSAWSLDAGPRSYRYNRVEGSNLILGADVGVPLRPRLNVLGEIGYGWRSQEITWLAGARTRFFRDALTLEGAYGRDVVSYGAGTIPGNSFTALLFGQDYGDYFLGEGVLAAIVFARGGTGLDRDFDAVELRVAYRGENQESIDKRTDFSFFQPGKDFRDNPPIDDGTVRRLELEAAWGNLGFGPAAMVVEAEFAGRGLGGDFRYEGARGELVGRRTIWLGDQVTGRLAGGVMGGRPPYQSLHFLGGFRTLRGYGINEFLARRWAHARLDYKLGTDLFKWAPFLRHLRLQLAPFADLGVMWQRQERDGTVVNLADPDMRASAGIGLQRNFLGIPGGVGQLRFDLANRLDRGHDDWTYRFLVTVER